MGSFAELTCLREDSIALKPAHLTTVQAASVPLVALTAWQVLVKTARVQPGQRVLIHAGSGGVGTIAIQLAKHLGAFVATTTSTANVEWVKALGADELEKSLKVLKPGGHLISISGPPTPQFAEEQKLNGVLKQVMRLLSYGIRRKARKHGVAYSFVFMRAHGAQLKEITRLIEAGIIKPILDRTFAFQQTAEALAYVEQGRAKGKVVVQLR